ncbi:nolO, partial [Symbiodinium microadriaticum]
DVDFDLLDRAYNHLQSQGMGTLELAVQDVGDSGQIAKQICDELGVPCPSYLEETVRDWVLSARSGARLQQRVSGANASQLTWERLSPPVREKKLTPVEQPEWKPPPGERNRKLLDEGCISLAREERYLTYYKQWRLWLGEAKLRLPPGRPADLVDFLLSRRDEPCGRTVPEATLKAIAWVEQVAEFPLEQRASHARLAWAAKDRIVEELSTGAKLTKRAPRYPVYMVAQLEGVVMDMGQTVGLRIWAWGKLLKENEDLGWLATGFNLLKDHAGYKRDYLLPRLGSDGRLERKMAGYADAMVATAALLTAMGLPGVVQGFWTEHSERAILPTALSLQDVAPQDKDLLGCKPSSHVLLEGQIATRWVPPYVAPENLSGGSSASESSEQSPPSQQLGKRIKVQEREARYVIVELPGGVARL